jgi:hypothetical protein
MKAFYEQYAYNVTPGPLHEGAASLPEDPPRNPPVRLIAYYLPQFHPVPENDLWWGTGFSEWTNVTKSVPRYVGHFQPRLPADLGFYDLRSVEVLRAQARLAKRSGIHGFCIHNYWFSGRKMLETPLRLLLANPDIDLPFCLNWANESWSRRWDGADHEVLLEQRYDDGDAERYAESILPALIDKRYIRVNGRPLIMLYRPAVAPDAKDWIRRWRAFLLKNGAGDPFVVAAQTYGDFDPRPYGADAAAGFPPHNGGWELADERDAIRLLDPDFGGGTASYAALADRSLRNTSADYRVFPGVCTGWDNEARKPGKGFSFYGSTPAAYGKWLEMAACQAMTASDSDERIVFINAWNEWAEGAYLEPDRHFGFAYLAQTRRVVDGLAAASPQLRRAGAGRPHRFAAPIPSTARRLVTRALRKGRRFMTRT